MMFDPEAFLQRKTIDHESGRYYVSMRDPDLPKKVWLLAGPFWFHREALAMVDRAREEAHKVDPWTWFKSVGTVRMQDDFDRPGKLNVRLGLEA